MKISTRTRYGTRLMLTLALNYDKGPIFLKDIAKLEGISEKYLSQIIIPLKAQGLVNSFRGAKGGYILAKLPSQTTVKEIFQALEGELSLVEPIKDANAYAKASICATHQLWNELNDNIAKTLASVTLEGLVAMHKEKEGKTLMYNI